MSPPLYYIYFIGGDAPSVFFEFPPIDLAVMLPGGEGEKAGHITARCVPLLTLPPRASATLYWCFFVLGVGG